MKKLICALLFAALLGAGWFLVRARTRAPDIVLIIIDTLRADKLSAYGHAGAVSPEIDQLAARGMLFETVRSTTSWTRASVGSIVTGRHPRTIGIRKEKWDPLDPREITLAEMLRDAGYHTVGVTANPQINSSFGFNAGFDTYIDSNVVFSWMPAEKGAVKASKSNRIAAAPEILGEALRLLKDRPDKPVYLQLLLMDVHAHDKMRSESIDADLKALPESAYLQTVRNTSRALGEFFRRAAEEARLKDAIVVITSDHGEGLSDHPSVLRSYHHGNLLYDSHVRVPLIISDLAWDHVPAARSPLPVSTLDIVPTIISMLGLQPHAGLQGRSLLPIMKGRSDFDLPEFFVAETEWRPSVRKIALYNDEWTYIENQDGWPGVAAQELQPTGKRQDGTATDRGAEHPELLKHFAAQLERWRAQHDPAAERSAEAPSETEVEQLKSLGYLQ